MGKKGGSRHLKRKPAPKFWPIHRKEYLWATKPKPGPHSLNHSLPLTIILRDILGYAKTRREAKIILSQGKVLVNGKIRKEEAFPVGLMDVISIPDAEATFRLLSHEKGFILHSVKKDESSYRLCRIENKTTITSDSVQLNLHDGTNKLIKIPDRESSSEDIYQVFDVIKVAIPNDEIISKIELAKNSVALITGGKNRGAYGKIIEVEEAPGKKRRLLLATIEDAAGSRFQTILDFIFVIGDSEQSLPMP
ncbi:MAG: 30S ribosomal protein S4e [Candidatus Bathyarchaeota archaeon]|nr:MAG: 30S ribosomal protein S4e [Candidatus Bathyarchaeota archaeon]